MERSRPKDPIVAMEIQLPESVVNQVLAALDSSQMSFDELIHCAIESYLLVESDASFVAFMLSAVPATYSQKRKPILRRSRQRNSKFRITQVAVTRNSRKVWTISRNGGSHA